MKLVKPFFFIFSLCAIFFTFSDYKSMLAQHIIVSDVQREVPELTLKEFEQLLPTYPNVSITTMPIDAYRAYYYYRAGLKEKSLELLEKGSIANPHIFFSEYLKSKIFLIESNLDSARYYAHKAYYGWPKTFLHYKIYNDILIKQNDTNAIIKAFEYSNTLIRDNDIYKNDFIRALGEVKLSSLVTYDELSFIPIDSLIGSWNEVREFNNGTKVEVLKTDAISFSRGKIKTEAGTYEYTLSKDTLNFYHLNQGKSNILSKSLLYYSTKYNSLVFYPTISNTRRRVYKKN